MNYTRYMVENFATFDYKTQEEVFTVIKSLTSVLSTTRMQLLEIISPSHLLTTLHGSSQPKINIPVESTMVDYSLLTWKSLATTRMSPDDVGWAIGDVFFYSFVFYIYTNYYLKSTQQFNSFLHWLSDVGIFQIEPTADTALSSQGRLIVNDLRQVLDAYKQLANNKNGMYYLGYSLRTQL